MLSIKRWMRCALGAALVLSLSACGSDDSDSRSETAAATAEPAKRPIVPETPPKVERGENGAIRYTGKTEEGADFEAQIGGDVSLPETFASEVPAYPGSVATSAMQVAGGTVIAALDTTDEASRVIDFYEQKLVELGWSVADPVKLGRGSLLTAEKDARKIVISAEATDGGSRYSLMVGPAS